MTKGARGVKVNGGKIKRLRKMNALTHRSVSAKTGLTEATLSRIENGHSAAIETLEKVAKVLGVDPRWLLAESPVDILLEGNGNGHEEPAAVEASAIQNAEPIDLSEASSTFMDRVEAGEVEEVRGDEERYFNYLPKYLTEPDPNGDGGWAINAFERDLAQGLAAMARRDRDGGAEEIRRVLRRMRKELQG